jgi:hypothetical protein
MNQESIQKTFHQEKVTNLGQKNLISNKKEFVQTIDDLFLKLELSYHYQFYKVFGTDEKLKEGKKLWAQSLKNFSSITIKKATNEVISTQSYLPTLTDLIKASMDIQNDDGFPSAEEAFIEARKSYSPRSNFNWSHPIVYFAGKKTGWNILDEKDNKEAFMSFVKIYSKFKKEASNGVKFTIKNSSKEEVKQPLNKKLLEELRKKHKI